jgi:pimeloyl-ACP methyl ester carboxylesterase
MAVIDFGPAERPVDVVFLHANGFNALTYRSILEPLAGTMRILACDQRGHGATSLAADPVGRESWMDLCDDLIALLRALDLWRVVLSGHSMGGTASLLAAAADPGRVKALALFDPVMSRAFGGPLAEASPMVAAARRRRRVFESREVATAAYRGRGAFATWPDVTLLDYVQAGFRDDPEGTVTLACDPNWEASNYAAQAQDAFAALAAFPGHVSILLAETGSTFRPPEDLDSSSLGPRVEIRVVAGTTHFLPMERPDLVRATLERAAGVRI